MWFMILILIAADGTIPRPPLLAPTPLASEAECLKEVGETAARLNGLEHIKALGSVKGQCVEIK